MNKKHFTYGSIFGLVAPFIGMFVGLQMVPFLGTILMLPFAIISTILDQPFGNFSTGLQILSVLLSIGFWGLVFAVAGRFFSKSDS